jgi:hypothetical protein
MDNSNMSIKTFQFATEEKNYLKKNKTHDADLRRKYLGHRSTKRASKKHVPGGSG